MFIKKREEDNGDDGLPVAHGEGLQLLQKGPVFPSRADVHYSVGRYRLKGSIFMPRARLAEKSRK